MVIMKKVRDGERVRNYGAWSREIAYRTVQNHWKRGKRVPVMLSDESLAAVVDAFAWQEEHHRHDDERVDRLRRCLDRLPDHMRRLVELFYDEGLTLEEIGRRLSRSAGAVQVALSRIRVRLLDCVGEIERREGALGS
jgi:RNA polymerase sigma-70 factor (ECF subfamily)